MEQTGSLDSERGFLNKWEMYKVLKNQENPLILLPKTKQMSLQSMQTMLEKYQTLYIKPVDSWGGKHISRISKISDGQYNWHTVGQTPQIFQRLTELCQQVSEFYQQMHCIVQQAISFVQYDGRTFDIRVHMQRDANDKWVYAGSLVRLAGSADSIISNVEMSSGSVIPTDQVLLGAFGNKKKKRTIKSTDTTLKQLPSIGSWICKKLEPYRKFNDIGIDLGIDSKGKLWLIEVNTDDALGGPSHELFAQLPDLTLYEQMRKRHEERQMGMAQWVIEAFFAE